MKKKFDALLKKLTNLKSKIKLNRQKILLLLVIILLTAGAYLNKGLFIAAVVNNQPITRLSLIREAEKMAGKRALDSVVTRTLIYQEAGKQKVTVSPQEVNDEIRKIEDQFKQQNRNLTDLLLAQGMTKNDLVEQIKLQKLVEKMAKNKISVTDTEIKDYFDKNQNAFAKDAKLEDVRADIKTQLEQQKLSEEVQTWVGSLHDKAKINYFVKF